MDEGTTNQAVAGILERRKTSRSLQVLNGIIAGLIADGELNDLEAQYLRTWLSENPEVANSWPGSAVVRHLNEVLSDGVITCEERDHLLGTLKAILGGSFVETGSVSDEVTDIPYDHTDPILVVERKLCFTGTFIYGTRNECEKLIVKAGGIPANGVTKSLHFLVVGTNVSRDWITTSYGLKIKKAMEMRTGGHALRIISERALLDSLGHR